MKILACSDIHSNIVALDCIEDLFDSVDQVICLGDLVGYYSDVNEVIDRLRCYSAIAVRGNHDHFLLNGAPKTVSTHVRWAIDHADKVITSSNRNYLSNLPFLRGCELFGRRLLMSHGSPWRPIDDYLYADSAKIPLLSSFDFDVIAFGQTHRPWIKLLDKKFILNCGSVGQSRQSLGIVNAWIIDLATMSYELVERKYDPQVVINKARKLGAGDWITKHLI